MSAKQHEASVAGAEPALHATQGARADLQKDDSDEDEWDVPDFNKDEASSAATTVLSVAAADAAKDAGTFSDEEDEVRWLCSAKLGGPAHSSFMPCLANSI